MLYTLKVSTIFGDDYPYIGHDHKAALAAAKVALLDDKTLDIELSCLVFQEDCSWNLRLTDGTVTKVCRNRQPEVIIPF